MCVEYAKFASFTFDYHVHAGEPESHVMKLIASHIHSISPKVTSHVIFWAAKMVSTKCSEKKGCHLSSFVFLHLAFSIAVGYG